jgi:hypothetical protein
VLIRKCEVFLHNRGELLSQHGFIPDPGQVERTDAGEFVFYHYTRPQHLEQIFAPGSGLWARLPVVYGELSPHLKDCFLVEGLLEPLPQWLTDNPYFGDLGLQMMRAYVGNILLRIVVPPDFPGLYVADPAHTFEGKHAELRGGTVLNIGYNCRTGRETMLAELHSYMPVADYRGGHVAPNVKATRRGQGIVVPKEIISMCDRQPFQER